MPVICSRNDAHSNWTALVMHKGSSYCQAVHPWVMDGLGDGGAPTPQRVTQTRYESVLNKCWHIACHRKGNGEGAPTPPPLTNKQAPHAYRLNGARYEDNTNGCTH